MSVAWARLRPERARGHRHLLTGSAVLVAGAAIQALSGAVFWLVAAKLDLEVDVGSAGKLFTSVLFVTYLAGLGLPVALARYAADRSPDADVTFTWASIATVAAAVVAAIVYVELIPLSATKVLTDWHPVFGPLLFSLAVAGAALSMIVDVRCMTARRWNLVMVRISVVGLVRFPMLFLFRDHEHRALWLFVYAVGPLALSGLAGAALAPRAAGGGHRLGPRPPTTGLAVRYSAVNYVSTLAYQAPYFALPVIVLANVSAETYASFNVAWGIVAVAFYVPTALGQALLAEGGRDGAHVHAQVRLALGIALGLMLVGAATAFVFSDVVETVYGPEYRQAARVLPAMIAAGVPWAVTSLYLSEARILHRHVATVTITGVLTAAILAPAALLVPGDGIDGASRAWLIGNLAAAAVAVVAIQLSRWRAGSRAGGADRDPSLAEPAIAADAAEVGITLAEPSV